MRYVAISPMSLIFLQDFFLMLVCLTPQRLIPRDTDREVRSHNPFDGTDA